MPRIYTSSNDAVDLCRRHYPATEEDAFAQYGHDGDGPDGRGNCFGYDAEHPWYNGGDPDLRCRVCKKYLGEEDE